MDSAWTSIIVFVLSVFVLIFFVGQAFFAGGEKVTTETAFTYSMTEDIPFEGVFQALLITSIRTAPRSEKARLSRDVTAAKRI